MGRSGHTFGILRRTLILSMAVAAWVLCFHPALCAGQAIGLDLTGTPIDPFKASAGKIVVLIFVRTDCPVSNRYSPTIQHLNAEYRDKAAFWLVYPSKTESPGMIRKHEQDFGYRFPALRDVQRALVKQGRVAITPEAAVFDANHRLVYHGRIDNLYENFGRARSAPTTHELDDAIQAAIHGKRLPADTVPAVGCYIADLQ
jgi:thiol-disulfide isomerase/thioredoxin